MTSRLNAAHTKKAADEENELPPLLPSLADSLPSVVPQKKKRLFKPAHLVPLIAIVFCGLLLIATNASSWNYLTESLQAVTQTFAQKPCNASSSGQYLLAYEQSFGLFDDISNQITKSDIAYLDHCNIDDVNKEAFFIWLQALIDVSGIDIESIALANENSVTDLQDEITLQGLEIYAKASRLCDYSRYKPSLEDTDAYNITHAKNILMTVPLATSNKYARIAFVISAFSDVENLTELLKSIHMPHHLIIIHLERRTSPGLVENVQKIANIYNNVAVLQFGTILYPTDTISYVNLRIMRWLLDDLGGLSFDYLFLIAESAFPLWGAKEMAEFLKTETPRVRLGTMVYNDGRDLCRRQAASMRLLYTRGVGEKYPIFNVPAVAKLPPLNNATVSGGASFFLPRAELQSKCTLKSNSGNTAAYDYATVKKLLHSTDAMEWLSHFKYVDGCCMVESSWVGAMEIIGNGQEATEPGAMWQAWGCRGSSMKNTVLAMGNYTCFDVHDTSSKRKKLNGENELLEELKNAKKRGQLFSRKFDSLVKDSVALRTWIVQNIHA